MITQSLRCLRDENEVIHPCLTSHGKRVAGVVFAIRCARQFGVHGVYFFQSRCRAPCNQCPLGKYVP